MSQTPSPANNPVPRTSLLRSASLSSLFKKRRHHDSDSETVATSNDTSSDDDGLNFSPQAHKKRKTELHLKRAEFLQKEHGYTEELPEELRKFRPVGFRFKLPPSDRPVRVYADGVFDLFHLGHMRQLEQAKKALPNAILICGIPSDVETHKRKGLTVLSDYQRVETLKHCKWVDEVIPDAPWCVTPEFLKKHQIDYVAHDDLPYASGDSDDIYKPIKEKGMFLTTQRTEGVSTSDIITKIIRDYDKYLMRNFARGATRQELNVSWFKKNELEFKKHINDFRSYWKRTNLNLNNASRDLYFEVREYLLKKSIQKDLNRKTKRIKTLLGKEPAEQFAQAYTGESGSPALSSNIYKKKRNSEFPSFIESFKDWMVKADYELSDRGSNETRADRNEMTENKMSSSADLFSSSSTKEATPIIEAEAVV